VGLLANICAGWGRTREGVLVLVLEPHHVEQLVPRRVAAEVGGDVPAKVHGFLRLGGTQAVAAHQAVGALLCAVGIENVKGDADVGKLRVIDLQHMNQLLSEGGMSCRVTVDIAGTVHKGRHVYLADPGLRVRSPESLAGAPSWAMFIYGADALGDLEPLCIECCDTVSVTLSH
jgi:hypothetical protein